MWNDGNGLHLSVSGITESSESRRATALARAVRGWILYDDSWPLQKALVRPDVTYLGVPLARMCVEKFAGSRERILMLADAADEYPPTDALNCVYVADCDAAFARAVKAGAEVMQPLEDKFYGDRAGSVRDPFGQRWSIMTHKEDVPPDEMQRRMAKFMGG